MRLGAGLDVIHKQGTAVASIKYGPASAFLWGDNYGAALTYDVGRQIGWNAGLGAMLVAHTDEVVGTSLNGLLRLSYCLERMCFTGIHVSHGATFGIATDERNGGLNFLLLEFR